MIFAKQKILSAWMSRQEFANEFNQCSKENAARRDEFMTNWARAQDKKASLVKNEAGLADGIAVSEVDPLFGEKLSLLREQPVFRNTFKDCSTEFKMVEIDKLIVYYSCKIRLGFIDHLLKKFSRNPHLSDLIDVCLPQASPAVEVDRDKIDDFTYLYSSDSLDLRVIDVISRPVSELNLSNIAEGTPVRAIITLIGFGFPEVLVARVGNRFVLENGYHRLYALRSLGVKSVPVVVSDKVSYAGHVMPQEYLVNSPRPPLFKDFFDPELTTELEKPRLRRQIRVSINPQVFDSFM